MTTRTLVCTCTAALLLAANDPAGAQTAAWQYELTPYLWGSAMRGDVQSGDLPQIGVDMSFGEIVDILDFGLMGAFEARNGRWGLLFDMVYMKVSDDATASRTGPGPIGAPASVHADATFKQTLLAAAATYRVHDGRSPVDLFGGLRYTQLDVEARIDASLFGESGSVDSSADKDWFDPYIGMRIQHPLGERWTFVGYADAGGFGVGSDFTWQAAVGINRDFSKTVTGKLGFRWIGADYDKGGFVYDMSFEGAYAGVGFRF